MDLQAILQKSVLIYVLRVFIEPSTLEFSLETNVSVKDVFFV